MAQDAQPTRGNLVGAMVIGIILIGGSTYLLASRALDERHAEKAPGQVIEVEDLGSEGWRIAIRYAFEGELHTFEKVYSPGHRRGGRTHSLAPPLSLGQELTVYRDPGRPQTAHVYPPTEIDFIAPVGIGVGVCMLLLGFVGLRKQGG